MIPDDDTVDTASGDELSGVANYTGGFAGAGRKTASISVAVDDTNNRANIIIGDLTWTALGAGDTIGAAILIKEITNDAASRLIAYFDLTDTATNGGDITLDFAAAGNILVG